MLKEALELTGGKPRVFLDGMNGVFAACTKAARKYNVTAFVNLTDTPRHGIKIKDYYRDWSGVTPSVTEADLLPRKIWLEKSRPGPETRENRRDQGGRQTVQLLHGKRVRESEPSLPGLNKGASDHRSPAGVSIQTVVGGISKAPGLKSNSRPVRVSTYLPSRDTVKVARSLEGLVRTITLSTPRDLM